MKIYHLSYPFELPQQGMPDSQVMAIGDFDGVHLGHREVIRRALRTARSLSLPVSIMTFHPHPREVLGLSEYKLSLTPLPDKLERFREMGIEFGYVISFDRPFSEMTAEQFVGEVLLPLQIESVIVGFDFRFGYQGKGTADTLALLSRGRFTVEVVRPYQWQGGKVSSTKIREYVALGQVEQAAELLGREFSLRGIVVTGDGRGRTIGFPTANIEPMEHYVLPARGVYAVRVKVRDLVVDGVMNIGVKPTFATGELKQTLEAHLFDFAENIYGEEVEVAFVAYLRAERKFASVGELLEQIGLDAETARRRLTRERTGR